MPGPLYLFFVEDHARLEELLHRIVTKENTVEETADDDFRRGLLRHIAMEEKVLLPFALEKRGGTPLPLAVRLRLDHGALAALLVPPPSALIVTTIETILASHNPLEEGSGGLYETCEALAGPEVDALLDRLRSVPEVRVKEHVHGPQALEMTQKAVELAGYRFDYGL